MLAKKAVVSPWWPREIRKLAESTSKNSSSIGKTLGELVKKIDRAQEASRNSSRAFDDIKKRCRFYGAILHGDIHFHQGTGRRNSGYAGECERTKRDFSPSERRSREK
jgi:hypothetical protein